MSESIPPALQPPVAVALAKLVKTFPGPDALPGVMYSEPKRDGYLHWTESTQRPKTQGNASDKRPQQSVLEPVLGGLQKQLIRGGAGRARIERACLISGWLLPIRW